MVRKLPLNVVWSASTIAVVAATIAAVAVPQVMMLIFS